LHKCLHNEQQIDRKAGGAGLGLYLMTNASSEVYFNVLPGVATEAVCVFDLEQAKLQLESFGFFHERIDAGGRLAGGPSRRLPTGATHPVERRSGPRAAPAPPAVSRTVIALLVGMIGVVIALIAAVAWPRATAATTTVEIRTEPKGATVELEGRNVGTATDGSVIAKDTTHTFEFGFVQATPPKLLQLGAGPGVARAAFEVGPHRVTVLDEDGSHPVSVVVKVGATVTAN
nr:hypothetical protein [Deltaproteobacteria bacterium]